MSPQAERRRPWLAAVLAVVQPGLGHVYLREWARSLVWFGTWGATVLLVVPPPEATLAEGVVAYAVATFAGLQEAPFGARVALMAVSAFSMVDAYWLAARHNDAETEGPHCPHCGKEVDESLEFCHWCTEPLDENEPTP